jgi:hypothetical protein
MEFLFVDNMLTIKGYSQPSKTKASLVYDAAYEDSGLPEDLYM